MHDDEPSAASEEQCGASSDPAERPAPERRPGWVDVGLGALNGVLGDYLTTKRNGLATGMAVVHRNEPLRLDRESVARAFPGATAKVCVFVHGLCCTEASWEYGDAPDRSYGSQLRSDLGYTPVFVRYNTGLRISDNGRSFARLLDSLLGCYPGNVEELTLIGHSMGGLVIRSACMIAEAERLRWLDWLRRAIYIGSPHQGAPLEKVGNVVSAVLGEVPDPFARLARDLINRRSDGIKDLRYANLRDEDWQGVDPDQLLTDRREPVALRAGIDHYVVAGTLVGSEKSLISRLLGDGLVRVPSATAPTRQPCGSLDGFAEGHVRLFEGLHHMRLARDPGVYAQLLAWCRDSR